MVEQTKAAYEAWRRDDAAARQAESRLARVWETHARELRAGPAPSLDLAAEAWQQRAAATRSLSHFLTLLGAKDLPA